MGGGAVGRGGGTEWLREVVHGGHRELHGGVWDRVGAEGPVGGAKARGGRMSGLLRGLARGRARRGREEGEAWSAVLYWGSLTVPRAEAAGTRGRGVPGDGAWHWDVRAADTTQGSEAVHCRGCTVRCPKAVRQCIARVPLPTAPRQRGSVLQELHCPLLWDTEAVHCRSSTAHCPQAVGQCIAGVPLPTEEDGPPLALQEIPNTPWAGLPVPPGPVRPVL